MQQADFFILMIYTSFHLIKILHTFVLYHIYVFQQTFHSCNSIRETSKPVLQHYIYRYRDINTKYDNIEHNTSSITIILMYVFNIQKDIIGMVLVLITIIWSILAILITNKGLRKVELE